MWILAGVPVGGDLKWEWGCWRRQFLAIWVTTSSETSKIRPAILYDDMLPFVGQWLIAKWMTLSGYFMFNSVFALDVLDSEGSIWRIITWKLINVDSHYQRQKCTSITLVSGNINHLYIFEGVSCWDVFKLEWGLWNRRICCVPAAISS